jgi:hypothetical protein
VDVGLSRCCAGRVNSAFVPLVLVLLLVVALFWPAPGGMLMPEPGPGARVLFGGPVDAGRRLRVCWKRLRRTEDWDMFGMLVVCVSGSRDCGDDVVASEAELGGELVCLSRSGDTRGDEAGPSNEWMDLISRVKP